MKHQKPKSFVIHCGGLGKIPIFSCSKSVYTKKMQTFSAMGKDLIIFFQRRTSFFSALKLNYIELRSEYVNDGNKINDDFVFNNDYIPTGKREMVFFL